MSNRTKIFSIIVCCLLIVPVLLNPPDSKEKVLGVNESVKASSSNSSSNPQAQSSNTSNENSVASSNNSQSRSTSNTSSQSSNSKSNTNKSNSLFPKVSLPSLPKFELKLPSIGGGNSNQTVKKNEIYNVRDITSGVRDKTNLLFPDENESKDTISGQIFWESGETKKIISNKFELGSSLFIQTSKSSTSVVVSDSKVLPLDTILIVDQNTFIELGGNPQNQKFINATVRLSN